MNSVTGYDRASVLDLAVIAGGGLECAFEFCAANGLSLTDPVTVGRVYEVPAFVNADSRALERITAEGIRPATALSGDELAAAPPGGIGFMGVGIDFIVS